jgi:hypothetical protein
MTAQETGRVEASSAMPPETRHFRSAFGIVHAVQLTERNSAAVYEWAYSGPIFAIPEAAAQTAEVTEPQVVGLTIFTAAGRMRADFGDWVVLERTGRFFPYPPALFEELFHEVNDA